MFTYELREIPGGLVLGLAGDLDTHAASEFDAFLTTVAWPAESSVTVDLSELTYLNSTGLRSFIRLHKQFKASGRSFSLTGASAKIFRIFRYCGLDTYFTFEHLVAVVPTAAPAQAQAGRPEVSL